MAISILLTGMLMLLWSSIVYHIYLIRMSIFIQRIISSEILNKRFHNVKYFVCVILSTCEGW